MPYGGVLYSLPIVINLTALTTRDGNLTIITTTKSATESDDQRGRASYLDALTLKPFDSVSKGPIPNA